MKHKNGFTLSETLIVVIVLGIIATLTIPALVNKNKESVAKTKVRKAMAAYESALNKMIIENDLKSDDTLAAWAGDAENNCANSTNYFKKVQGDGCIFKTSDGIWWDISNIERPVISFKEINTANATQITTNANNANDKTAFVLVGRFGTDGSLRVDDLAYETANDTANSKAQVEKLYSLLGLKTTNAGSVETISCDDDDIVCKYKRGDTLPTCTGIEKKSCVIYEDEELHMGEMAYVVYNKNGKEVCIYYLANDNDGNEYKQMEYFYDEEDNLISMTDISIDSNGKKYVSLSATRNSDGSYTQIFSKESSNGEIYVWGYAEYDETNEVELCSILYDSSGNETKRNPAGCNLKYSK